MSRRGWLDLGAMTRLSFLLISALFFGQACTQRADTGSFQVQLSSEPMSLDPALAEDGAALRVLGNVMDGLYGYDGKGTLEPRLAESATASEGGKKWTIVLKSALWSDGVPVTAEHFVLGIKRGLDPKNASKMASNLFEIKNARKVFEGKMDVSALGVKAEADRLTFELERPVAAFLHLLTLPGALPSRQDVLDAHKGRWPAISPSTGPYRIAEYIQGQYLKLFPVEQATTGNNAKPVVFRIVEDESTGAHLFERGVLQILMRIPIFERPRFIRKGWVRVDPFFATYFLAFNLKKAPFQDAAWRRAVAAAINKEEVVSILDSGERPASSWIPYGLEGYFPFKTEVPVARKEVYLPPIVAGFDSSSRNASIMEKVQHDLAERLGLRLTLQNQDWKSYIRGLSEDAPPIFRFGMMAPFHDPIFHLQAFTSDDPNNYTGYRNADYDRLVRDIRATSPGKKRDALIQKAQQKLLVTDAVIVPLYHYVQSHAVSPRVEGFEVNPFGVIRFNRLKLSP